MPNNQDNGDLETLCLRTVTHTQSLTEIDGFIQKLDGLGLIHYDRANTSIEDKARLQMYLATIAAPGGHVVRGLENDAFDLASAALTPLLDFLKLL